MSQREIRRIDERIVRIKQALQEIGPMPNNDRSKIITQGGADHCRRNIPLAEQAGDDSRVIKNEFAYFLNQCTCIMRRKLFDHHDGNRGEHSETDINRWWLVHWSKRVFIS